MNAVKNALTTPLVALAAGGTGGHVFPAQALALELVTRGFVFGEGEETSTLKDAAGVIAACIESSSVEARTDQGLMTEKLRGELRRFFKKRSGRRPLVLPVLMEI